MSVETPITIEDIDFSIDPKLVETAENLLGHPDITREQAKAWIHSPVKEFMERAVIGLLGTLVTSPVSIAAMSGVVFIDGYPATYDLEVAFLGQGNRLINLTPISKIRTLSIGADTLDKQSPLQTTVFRGTRKSIEEKALMNYLKFGLS